MKIMRITFWTVAILGTILFCTVVPALAAAVFYTAVGPGLEQILYCTVAAFLVIWFLLAYPFRSLINTALDDMLAHDLGWEGMEQIRF